MNPQNINNRQSLSKKTMCTTIDIKSNINSDMKAHVNDTRVSNQKIHRPKTHNLSKLKANQDNLFITIDIPQQKTNPRYIQSARCSSYQRAKSPYLSTPKNNIINRSVKLQGKTVEVEMIQSFQPSKIKYSKVQDYVKSLIVNNENNSGLKVDQTHKSLIKNLNKTFLVTNKQTTQCKNFRPYLSYRKSSKNNLQICLDDMKNKIDQFVWQQMRRVDHASFPKRQSSKNKYSPYLNSYFSDRNRQQCSQSANNQKKSSKCLGQQIMIDTKNLSKGFKQFLHKFNHVNRQMNTIQIKNNKVQYKDKYTKRYSSIDQNYHKRPSFKTIYDKKSGQKSRNNLDSNEETAFQYLKGQKLRIYQ